MILETLGILPTDKSFKFQNILIFSHVFLLLCMLRTFGRIIQLIESEQVVRIMKHGAQYFGEKTY